MAISMDSLWDYYFNKCITNFDEDTNYICVYELNLLRCLDTITCRKSLISLDLWIQETLSKTLERHLSSP